MKIRYLVDADEMRSYDNYTIDNIGIPAMVLMERAALAVISSLDENVLEYKTKRILVVCGGGNNGGDGLAVARLLLDNNCKVDIVLLTDEEKCSLQTKQQLAILQAYISAQTDVDIFIDIKDIIPILNSKEYDIIIDGIFGVGLSRRVEGRYLNCINAINGYGAYIVSLDVPSGIDSGNGRCLGDAIKADLTVTFSFAKRGLYLYPGKKYAGKIDCRDIGISEKSFQNTPPNCFTFPNISEMKETELLNELKNMLPERIAEGNKGTFGKLLIVAGSKDMCGACILCGESAYRTGAGMVKIVTPEENRNIIQSAFPEAMLLTYESNNIPVKGIVDSLKWADGVIIGPGIGQSKISAEILEIILKETDGMLILDADALNILSVREDLRKLLKNRSSEFTDSVTIITPHQGEMARLTGKDISELKECPVMAAKAFAAEYGCIVVNKDAVTVVCDENPKFFINNSGNSGMATAGSGDVLSGILGGILVQKQERCKIMLESVAQAVYLHGCAGDLAKKRVGEHGMIAGDIIESLKEISKEG